MIYVRKMILFTSLIGIIRYLTLLKQTVPRLIELILSITLFK